MTTAAVNRRTLLVGLSALAYAVVFAMFVVLINLAMDLIYIVVDPRIRVK